MLRKTPTSFAGKLAIGGERVSLVADSPPCFWPASIGDRPLPLQIKWGQIIQWRPACKVWSLMHGGWLQVIFSTENCWQPRDSFLRDGGLWALMKSKVGATDYTPLRTWNLCSLFWLSVPYIWSCRVSFSILLWFRLLKINPAMVDRSQCATLLADHLHPVQVKKASINSGSYSSACW